MLVYKDRLEKSRVDEIVEKFEFYPDDLRLIAEF